jgi:uncharacterized protein YoxC
MIIEISVAVVAVMLSILILYTVSLMKTAKLTMQQANQSLSQMQLDLKTIKQEATSVMQDTNLLIKDVQTKMHAFDPLFASVNQTGEVLAQLTGSAKQISAAVNQVTGGVYNKASDNKDRIADVMEMTKAGIKLWQKFQSIRHSLKKNGDNKKE